MREFLKKEKKMLIITSIVTLLPIVAGLILWDKLPAQIATHFNAEGKADGYSGKAFAVWGLPLILFGTHIMCAFTTMLDPKAENQTSKIRYMILWIMPITSIMMQAGVLGIAMGIKIKIGLLAQLLIAVLFIMIGNYLPKCHHNYTVGIKTPWTLADEEVWDKTHKQGGLLWIICGLIMILNALTVNNSIVMWIIIAIIVMVPSTYSYIVYKKKYKKV
jgi:uncharacterized membrane protein